MTIVVDCHKNSSSIPACSEYVYQAFFLTSVAEKTKTQAQNSSQKLKEKTQPQGENFLLLSEIPEKN